MAPLTPKEMLYYLLEYNTLTPDQLDEFIQKNPDEDQYFDYKDGSITTSQNRSERSKTIREYISGFANSDGGILIIGVSENQPRQIAPCATNVGKQPLAQWASSCLHDMVAYFSPQPRFQVIKHPQGLVLAIAVARAPSLVPCIKDGKLNYFFRIGDSTLQVPEYLIADLVLGRRQHPLLNLVILPVDLTAQSVKSRSGRDDIPARCATFSFTVENLSLVTAEDVKIGAVSWSLVEGSPEDLNTHLRSYLDICDVKRNGLREIVAWGLVHRSSTSSGKKFNLEPFQNLPIRGIGPFYFPRDDSAKVFAAVYIISKGAPPTWFQIEFDYSPFSGIPKESIVVNKQGSEHSKVAWE